jgi:hypothetical protein
VWFRQSPAGQLSVAIAAFSLVKHPQSLCPHRLSEVRNQPQRLLWQIALVSSVCAGVNQTGFPCIFALTARATAAVALTTWRRMLGSGGSAMLGFATPFRIKRIVTLKLLADAVIQAESL